MTTKRFIKKLVLNKETVSNLAGNDMVLARAGGGTLLQTGLPCTHTCPLTEGYECETNYTDCINCAS